MKSTTPNTVGHVEATNFLICLFELLNLLVRSTETAGICFSVSRTGCDSPSRAKFNPAKFNPSQIDSCNVAFACFPQHSIIHLQEVINAAAHLVMQL